jgi:hypothetical protein
MATSPTPQPQDAQQQGAPDNSGAPSGAPQGASQDANQLQEMLAQLLKATQTIGSQNTVIAPEMQEAAEAFRKAFVKTVQASAPPQPQQQSPPM